MCGSSQLLPHHLGAFMYNKNPDETPVVNSGTIFVFATQIEALKEEWNNSMSSQNFHVTTEDMIVRTLVHEFCHVLIDGTERYILFDGSSKYYEYQRIELPGGVVDYYLIDEVSASTLGARDSFLMYLNFCKQCFETVIFGIKRL